MISNLIYIKASNVSNWKKLTRMIRYLHESIDMLLILQDDSVPIPKWRVDGSHVTHPNMCGHTGGCMLLGKGMLISTSTKQKLNTCRSTETECVAADDFMPIILWTNYFLEAQGYGYQYTILYQDNQSAILQEKNSRKSSSKRTKHLTIDFIYHGPHQYEGSLHRVLSNGRDGWRLLYQTPSRKALLQVQSTHYEFEVVIIEHFPLQECVGIYIHSNHD